MNTRAYVEPKYVKSGIWMFVNTTSLRRWIERGAKISDIGLEEDAFYVLFSDIRTYAYAQKIGCEFSWHKDGTYDRYDCSAVAVLSPKLNGSTMSVYVGWTHPTLFSYENYSNEHIRVKKLSDSDELVRYDTNSDNVDSDKNTIADAFVMALKSIESCAASESHER